MSPVHLCSGGQEAKSCENRNGAASAVLHVEEAEVMEKINHQRLKSKSKKHPETRHIQTGTVIVLFLFNFVRHFLRHLIPTPSCVFVSNPNTFFVYFPPQRSS